jgi:hypothetical protein
MMSVGITKATQWPRCRVLGDRPRRICHRRRHPDRQRVSELTAWTVGGGLNASPAEIELASPCRVDRLTTTGNQFSVLTDGSALSARTVVAATGAVYRCLPLAGWQRLEGAGIYYAATELKAGLCAGSPVVVLGGGNSAGQATLYLARHCPEVTRWI